MWIEHSTLYRTADIIILSKLKMWYVCTEKSPFFSLFFLTVTITTVICHGVPQPTLNSGV